MARIEELIEKYRAHEEALKELQDVKIENRKIEDKITDLFVKMTLLKDQIREKRQQEASKLWGEMEQGRFTYGLTEEQKTNPNPYYGPDFIDATYSTAYISVMGLKLPVAKLERGRIVSVEELMVLDEFNPKFYTKGLFEKFELDPEGTKKAVCESVRVRAMKDSASCPVELRAVEKDLAENKAKLAKLEKLLDEEVPDNAIMRKIFKKKFEAIENAPKDIEETKKRIEELEIQKGNLEYRLSVAEKLTNPEAIMEYVESELAFLRAFVERDWSKEVGKTSTELADEVLKNDAERSELKKQQKPIHELDSKVSKLKRAFEKDFESISELFNNKEFVDELKTVDVSKLSEEEKKIVEVIKSQYEQYLAKTIAKYEE